MVDNQTDKLGIFLCIQDKNCKQYTALLGRLVFCFQNCSFHEKNFWNSRDPAGKVKKYDCLCERPHRKVNEYIPLLFSTWLIILDDRIFVAFTHLEFFAPMISLCFNFQNVINWLLQSIYQDTLKIQDPSSTFRVLWYSVFAFIIMSASKYL